MPKHTDELETITVLSSWAAATPDGRTALVLETVQSGTIAFEVDTKAVAAIRDSLASIEQLWAHKPGHA